MNWFVEWWKFMLSDLWIWLGSFLLINSVFGKFSLFRIAYKTITNKKTEGKEDDL